MHPHSTAIAIPGRICTSAVRHAISTRRNNWEPRTLQRQDALRCRLTCASSSGQEFVSGSDLLGPKLESVSTEEQPVSTAEAVAAVELNSERDLDFTKLIGLLSSGDFKKADDESRALLLQLAGDAARSRGWIYFTEVPSIPATDLKTIDELWKASSNGKFGYSVQKKIFARSQRRWTKFFKAIDWTVGENNNYRKWPTEFIYSLDAKPGHLPLTNCLRGTQLFEGLMFHKAFETEEAPREASSMEAKKWTTL